MKKLFIVINVVLIIVLIGAVNYSQLTKYFSVNLTDSKKADSKPNDINSTSVFPIKNKFNLLVVGADASYQNQPRADTLMIVSFDLTTERIGILSIPRDTRVTLPGYSGYHKINAAYSYGGLELTKQVVKEQFQIEIDHHLQVDYQGFINLVEILGGIRVEVEEDLYYVDQAANLNIDIKTGMQNLTGEEALGYLRFRDKIKGDIGRIERQQKFLQSALKQTLNLRTIIKLPELIREVKSHLDTDIKLGILIKLANKLIDINTNQLKMVVLPGKPEYIGGISYWLANEQASAAVINSLLKTKTYFQHQNIKVTVLNGAGIPKLADKVSVILSKQGYKIVEVGNADHFKYHQNYVFASDQQTDQIAELVEFIEGKLKITDKQEQITVILGHDKWDKKQKNRG